MHWWPDWANETMELVAPLRSINGYGLFRVMTIERPELILEGSPDGVRWVAYDFRYKPDAVDERPRFVAPLQPRLDWQLWFAALGSPRQNPWFTRLLLRLLEGTPATNALLATNPFPPAPPRYGRALRYDSHFTDPATRRQTGAWWRRELLGVYFPPVALR